MFMKVFLGATASLGLLALALPPRVAAAPTSDAPAVAASDSATASPTTGAAQPPIASPVAPLSRQVEATAAMIPSRLLDCDLGRITNFDPSRFQKPEDYRFEGQHPFRMYLPARPARVTPPPSALKAPEPVDPRTRILADPDDLSRGAHEAPFYRVIDLWPERVEMVTPVAQTASNLVVLDGYDAQGGTVNLFMTVAQDGMTFDLEHLYAGRCKVTLGKQAEAAAG